MEIPTGVADVLEFPLIEALLGRRARRFSRGTSVPDGPLAYASRHAPAPLTEFEKLLLLTATAGNTGWHYMITRNARYAPHLANYSAAAGGRTFPSAAGFHTSELFFTDDSGTYLFATRDAPALVESDPEAPLNLEAWVQAHAPRIRKLNDKRLHIPRTEPYMEGHNTWCANVAGSLLVMPVADLAQHSIAGLCFLTQNGFCLTDDVNRQPIPGLERFAHMVDVTNPYPLSYIDQYMFTEAAVELGTACYAGMLMLQAVGLGGWMFDGIDRNVILGASGDPDVPGLGFRYATDDRWAVPNPTGLAGVFEGYCPPHFPTMRAAVEAFVRRKFGPGGPFHPDTPGAWKETRKVRSSAQPHGEEFIECVALQAQYVFDRFGKFPATVPSIFCATYLQAHHLDLDFYDTHFDPGAYLYTHADHWAQWHPEKKGG